MAMATTQALISISGPATPPCPFKKLGFSINSTRIALPRVSLRGFASTVSPLVAQKRRQSLSLVVRAEPEGSDSGEVAASDADAAVAVLETEAEVEEAVPKKPYVKLGDVMGILHKRAIDARTQERPIPELRTGDIVQIKLEVPRKRKRASFYRGIVISKQNAGIHTTIRIRRIIAGIGVEIVFPVYSPNVKEIKVLKHRKVRRARLYYLRDKLPRFSTFKFK